MIKWLLGRFRREPGLLKATVKIDFYPQDQVTPHIFWLRSQDPEADTIPVVVYVYARILFELAEMNEVRVARELMTFLEQVCQRVLSSEDHPRRPRLPLGQLRLVNDQALPALRTYELDLFQLPADGYRVEYRGSLGKEGYYLPGAFLALLQSCLDHLGDQSLRQLASRLVRLHGYYRQRRDFWDGGALTSGPEYAMGKKEIEPEQPVPEV
ncbi:MAG: hypothetical protein WCF59_08500 [Desulfobaccales bacterium]|jgi:hypothetical protein